MEAVNGNIKALLRRGRGYRDLDYLLLKAQRLAATKTEFVAFRSRRMPKLKSVVMTDPCHRCLTPLMSSFNSRMQCSLSIPWILQNFDQSAAGFSRACFTSPELANQTTASGAVVWLQQLDGEGFFVTIFDGRLLEASYIVDLFKYRTGELYDH